MLSIGRRNHHAGHCARIIIDNDVGLGTRVMLVSLSSSDVSRSGAFCPVFGRTGRVNQHDVYDGSLVPLQTKVAQIAIDHVQNPVCQRMFVKQPMEVANGFRQQYIPDSNWTIGAE